MNKSDYHSAPFETMVVMGESLVADGRWVEMLKNMISDYQGESVTVYNKGIGANVISPRSPGYGASARPSALERYTEDVIHLKPDLFILSCGLNDMRSGMHPEYFREDMRQIVKDVRQSCNSVIVLTTLYHMIAFDMHEPFNLGSVCSTEIFNLVIRQLAEEQDCILADIYLAQGQADWAVHPDKVHSNELGYFLVANRVFETLANHCSGVCLRESARV